MTENKPFPIFKHYYINVTLKETQRQSNGTFLVTGLNGFNNIDNFLSPYNKVCFQAIGLRKVKDILNALIDEQIESITIDYK